MSDAANLDFIPVMVPLAAAVFVESEAAAADDGLPYTAPIAILEFSEEPAAKLMFRQLADPAGPVQCTFAIDTWFGLPTSDRLEYEQHHDGHPLVRFVLQPRDSPAHVLQEQLAFLICAQCEALFFGELTQRDELAVGSTVPDHVSLDDPLFGATEIVLGSFEATDVAEAELWAWRNAYGNYTPHDLSSEPPASGHTTD